MTPIHRPAIVLLAATLAATTLAAQDPLVVSPQAYRLRFENEWVKVVHVRYAPGEALPPHFHTPLASAYVYLNDGGPTRFSHHDLPYGAVTRPATRAGSFRVFRGLKEVHSVEQDPAAGSEFLRVEFKTDPVDEATLKGKFFRVAPGSGDGVPRVQFDNPQVRIARIVARSSSPVTIATAAEWPALLVALDPTILDDVSPTARPRQLDTGEVAWMPGAHRVTARGRGDGPAELLRFEFKTHPRAGVTAAGAR